MSDQACQFHGLTFQLVRNALEDRDRLTAQLALEQTTSTRTIEQLVARKEALEEQYRVLGEQSRITLEVAAKRQEALEAQVQALEGERDALRAELKGPAPRAQWTIGENLTICEPPTVTET